MCFYWLHDRVNQGMFHVYWGPDNKMLPTILQQDLLPYITKSAENLCITKQDQNLNTLQGYVRILADRTKSPQFCAREKYLQASQLTSRLPYLFRVRACTIIGFNC